MASPYRTMYERLVAEVGLPAARAEMKRRRALVKKPGFANVDKAVVKAIGQKGGKASGAIRARKQRPQKTQSAQSKD